MISGEDLPCANTRYNAIVDAISLAIEKRRPSSGGLPVSMFNDDPATTFSDVLSVLREAREALL
jgi:hypothetical protein